MTPPFLKLNRWYDSLDEKHPALRLFIFLVWPILGIIADTVLEHCGYKTYFYPGACIVLLGLRFPYIILS